MSSASSVSTTFAGTQSSGDLNIAVIYWLDLAASQSITAVTDSRGNTYTLALQTATSIGIKQAFYYAKNIASSAAGNTVTVTFNTAASPVLELRIAEYGGLDTASPLDVAVGATGPGTAVDSGSTTTQSANDLLIGAGSWPGSASPGAGYTQRLATGTVAGGYIEDRVVTTTGSYSATATRTTSGSNSGDWIMQLVAFKAAGGGGDTQAPTTPAGFSATPASSTQINLSWSASTDNVAVTGYLVEQCQGAGCTAFTQIGTPATTSFNNTGLSPATTYRYRIRARDAVPNYSGYSTIVSATTLSAPDTQAPTAPTGLTLTAGPNRLVLVWNASTDNVGVVEYLIERCSGSGCSHSQIATAPTTSYTDTNVVPGTSYSYRVRARDAVPNYSGYSNVAVASPANCD